MIKFKKMHGNGNDFIIIENLTKVNALSKSQIVKIGDTNKGIGFANTFFAKVLVAFTMQSA